jgi:hypothetical protein
MILNSKTRLLLAATLVTALAIVVSTSHAAIISNLYNTGVDGIGNALAGTGTTDTHYNLIVPAISAVTVNDPGYPISPNGPWVANTPFSRWVSLAGNSIAIGANYDYQTNFFLPANTILSSVSVFGLWSVDDYGTDILINNTSTGNTKLGFTTLAPFAVTSGFVLGNNTLDFLVTNAFPGQQNPTGLRVDRVVGTYLTVPEPASICMAAVGLSISVAVARCRRSKFAAETRTS